MVHLSIILDIGWLNKYMKKYDAEHLSTTDNGFLVNFKGFFTKRITLMLIPHSEKKVFNIQVSLFSIVAVIVLFLSLLFSFFVLSSGYSGSLRVIDDRDGRIDQAEADLYKTSEAVEKLNESAEQFKQAINRTLQAVNINNNSVDGNSGRGGDLNNLLNIQESDASSSNDVKTIGNVTALLNSSVPQLVEISDQISKKSEHFVYAIYHTIKECCT